MSVEIDREKCVGCRRCHDVCPGSLIKIGSDDKAFIKYPKDCWGCTSCVKECPAHAVRFFLGADIGGMGSVLHIEKNGELLDWVIERYDGENIVVSVDPKESNKY